MFSQVWKKYLPVITILIKRSSGEDQKLSMNHTDFERAAGGRKIKYTFSSLQLNKGRINNMVKHTPLAKEFAVVLQEEDLTRKLIKEQCLEFSMNGNFELSIKNNTPPVEPLEENDAAAITANTGDEDPASGDVS
ncbi:MAG: hypothetical protein GC171_00065 [Terrimonas sp.]|nr:hypothetical protein [Terrimonas sp.]